MCTQGYEPVITEMVSSWGEEVEGNTSLEEACERLKEGISSLMKTEDEFFSEVDYDKWMETSKESFGKIFRGIAILENFIESQK